MQDGNLDESADETSAETKAAGSDLPLPELHLAGLLAQVRAELARRDAASQDANMMPVSPAESPGRAADWEEITRLLAEAEPFADAGATAPELRRLPQPLRWVGRLAARCVLLAARVVTNRQRRFNHVTLQGLRRLQEVTRPLDTAAAELNQFIRQQQARLERLPSKVADHGQALRLHDERLRQSQDALRRHQEHLRHLHAMLRAMHGRFDEQQTRIVRLEEEVNRLRTARLDRENAA